MIRKAKGDDTDDLEIEALENGEIKTEGEIFWTLRKLIRGYKLTVQHMLLSHHGIPEYGSPKVPMILEAQVLNLIDELDAKIYEFNEAAENTEPGTFSPKVFALGNIQVYKPNI